MTATGAARPATTDRVGGLPPLPRVLGRSGTRAVLLAGSRDPNAKVTLILLDDYGPAFVVKAPTTAHAARVVRAEGHLLARLRDLPLGRLAATVPAPLGYLDAGGLPALVTNAIPGVPMTIRYHAWRHTARPAPVRADFTAAGRWLAEMQTRTAAGPAPVTMFRESLDTIVIRFADHPALADVVRRLTGPALRLADHNTPRTVVHGDYWFGNLLVDRDRVVGVVDWEAGELAGEPLRDLARFAVSYALYLDRHTRAGRSVPGHRQLRAGQWGAGLAYALAGRGWFGGLLRDYLEFALHRLGVPVRLLPDVLLAGIADVAATADHPDFARAHLDLLARAITAGMAAA